LPNRRSSRFSTHDGWDIPAFDPAKYTVNVGFGVRIRDWVYWAYSVPCSPGQRGVFMAAGMYILARSNGGEQIGDPLPIGMEAWSLPLGRRYALTFDACGNGTLTTL
jgi:hypothetical protein